MRQTSRTKTLFLTGAVLTSLVLGGAEPASTAKFPTLVVNGKPIPGHLLLSGGRQYVAIDDLARGLQGSLSFDAERILLTLPEATPISGSGRIRGTLTYYFNANYGSVADTGAQVWLLPADFPDIADSYFFIGTAELLIIARPGNAVDETRSKVIKYTTADATGKYELTDVPPGAYVLVMQSSHSNGLTQRDVLGRVKVVRIEIHAGETLDKSLDFGMSAM